MNAPADLPPLSSFEETADQLFDEIATLCPAPDRPTSAERSHAVTVLVTRDPVGKRFMIDAKGKITKQSVATISEARCCMFHVPDHDRLQSLLTVVSKFPNAAVSNTEWTPVAFSEPFWLVSKAFLAGNDADPGAVHTAADGRKMFARLHDHAAPSVWQIIDRDIDEYTPPVEAAMQFDAWRVAMDQLLPGLSATQALRMHSASARVVREDGTPVGGGNGHLWIKVADVTDLDRCRRAIVPRAVVAGKVWGKPRFNEAGERVAEGWATICDPSVWVTGRLVFNGKPIAQEPLQVVEQQFDLIPGDAALDTTKATVDLVECLRRSHEMGRPYVPGGGDIQTVSHDLSIDTILELETGEKITVGEALRRGGGKLRCQTPFRASSSFAAFFNCHADGSPFVYDTGTGIKHVLTKPTRLSADVFRVVTKMKALLKRYVSPEDEHLVGYCIDTEVVAKAISRSWWNPERGSLSIVAGEGAAARVAIFSKSDAIEFGIKEKFAPVLLREILAAFVKDAKDVAALMKDQMKLIVQHIIAARQASSVTLSVDMFIDEPTLLLGPDGKLTVSFPHRPFDEARRFTDEEVATVWADYKEHFPEWEAMLQVVLHSRFIESTRRRSFIWLHCGSDWGKALLLAIFKDLGIASDLGTKEVEAAIAGHPSGLNPEEFTRSWLTATDEWKSASADLKQLNDSLSFSPKHKMKCSVPLFTKLFLSAEDNRSLITGGAEDQFNKRFSYINGGDAHIDDRELVRSIGVTRYRQLLAAGVARVFNAGVAGMRAMGKEEASKVSIAFVESFQRAHRLSDQFGDFGDTILEAAELLRATCRKFAEEQYRGVRSSLPPKLFNALSLCRRGYYRGFPVIQLSAPSVIDEFINTLESGSGRAKMGYKTGDLTTAVDQGGRDGDEKGKKYRLTDAKGEPMQVRGAIVFCAPVCGEPELLQEKLPKWLE